MRILQISFILVILFTANSCYSPSYLKDNKEFNQTYISTNYYSKLILKKNGKCIDYSRHFSSNSIKRYRGEWSLNCDTLVLHFKKYGLGKDRTFKYKINADFSKIYLLDGSEFYNEVIKNKQ